MIKSQLERGALRQRQLGQRGVDCTGQLQLRQLPVGPVGLKAFAFIVAGVDRLVQRLQAFAGTPVGDGKDPRRDLAAAIECRRLAPDHQERVVDDFLDQRRAARHALQEARQPWVVGPVQRLEGAPVARCDTPDELRFVVLRARRGRSGVKSSFHARPLVLLR